MEVYCILHTMLVLEWIFKGTESRYRIKIFWRILIVLGLKRNLYWFLNFEAAPQMSHFHCHFLQVRWKHIGESIGYLFVVYFCQIIAQYITLWKKLKASLKVASDVLIFAPLNFLWTDKAYWSTKYAKIYLEIFIEVKFTTTLAALCDQSLAENWRIRRN